MANDGKAYEEFVGQLHQALLKAQMFAGQKNIEIQRNKKLIDSWGTPREFDIYWEYELAGITYKTAIECKDYNSKITIEKIDALIGKIRDFPDLKAVFATKKGYQSGARTKAEHNKIDLLIVREQNNSDWTDADGTPLIKKVLGNLTIMAPARITNFQPLLDLEWAKENTDLEVGSEFAFSGLNNEIFIQNDETGERYSLYEMAEKLGPTEGKTYGEFETQERFVSAWIIGPDFRYKLRGYNATYMIPQPITESLEIDFGKELVGVIEYLTKGTKKSIFRNGTITEKANTAQR